MHPRRSRGWTCTLLALALVSTHVFAASADAAAQAGCKTQAAEGRQAPERPIARLTAWAHALPYTFTKEKASALLADARQFISVFNVIVLGPYYRILHTSWARFTWRLGRYAHRVGPHVAALRQKAQWLHGQVLRRAVVLVRGTPALSSVLNSEQLVGLMLLYAYSGLLALTVACVISACTSSGRSRLR